MDTARIVFCSAVVLATSWGDGAFAQEIRVDVDAAFRDAVFDDAYGRLYAAAFDTGSVFAIDPDTGTILGEVQSGAGASALALDATTGTIACVNRLDRSVVLFATPDLQRRAQFETGNAPADIVSLGNGAFLVANSFDDSLVIATADGSSRTIASPAAVPVLLAHTPGTALVAIAGQLDSEVVLWDFEAAQVVRRIALDAPAAGIAALAAGNFVIASRDELRLESARATVATQPTSATAIAALGSSVWAIAETSVVRFDASLEAQERRPIPVAGAFVARGTSGLAVAAPQTQSLWILPGNRIETPQLAHAPPPPSPAPVDQEPPPDAEPVLQPDPKPESERVVVAEPAPTREEPAMQPASEPELQVAGDQPLRPAEAPPLEGDPITVVEAPDANQPEPLAETPLLAEEAVEADAPERPGIEATVAGEPQLAAVPAEPPLRPSPRPQKPQPRIADDTPRAKPSEVDVAEEMDVAPDGVDMAAADDAIVLQPSPVRQVPFRSRETRAPSASPQATASNRINRRSIQDAFSQPIGFGRGEGGFEVPDLSEPAPTEATLARRPLGGGSTELVDARLQIGGTAFEADRLVRDDAANRIEASGNVRLTQNASTLTADRIEYLFDRPQDTAPPVLVPSQGFPFGGRPLQSGRLLAENVDLQEPNRDLRAQIIDYDFAEETGYLQDVRGRAGVLYLGATEFRILGPADAEGDDVWITSCDHDPPHYRIKVSRAILNEGAELQSSRARLQVFNTDTPLFVPKWTSAIGRDRPWNVDFDFGRRAEIGAFGNVGVRFDVNRDVSIGPRLFVTEKEGVGFGADLAYDFRETPSSYAYKTSGEISGLFTTDDRGYIHAYHRYDQNPNLVAKVQVEQWSDEDFYQDFYFDQFRNRTSPRSFANVTYRQPGYIATGTLGLASHDFVRETARRPEATFSLLERQLVGDLYLSYDAAAGYYTRVPVDEEAFRTTHSARLTYNWDPAEGISVTPFIEGTAAWYSQDRQDEDALGAISGLAGVTAQTRLTRSYGGFLGFSAFKHVVVPSVTLSHRPDTALDVDELPIFDARDNLFGRTRLETKLANVVYGRDAETNEVWQVARLTLYQGNDFRNEVAESEDYEVELDIRPRPWWGVQLVGERHSTVGEFDLDRIDDRRPVLVAVRDAVRDALDEEDFDFGDRASDYDRFLAQAYYDNTVRGGKWEARLGFAYTETENEVFNREILYGMGYRLSEGWGIGFEQRYDFELGELRSQTYEIRRKLHCWETAIRVRDREAGFDVSVEFYLTAFPGSRFQL